MQVKLNRSELDEAITKHTYSLMKEMRAVADEPGVFTPEVGQITIHEGGTGATVDVAWWPVETEAPDGPDF